MFSRRKNKNDIAFEESFGDTLTRDSEIREVSLGNRPLFYLGVTIFITGAIFVSRILYLNIFRGEIYNARAESNLTQSQGISAPRGLIFDKSGETIVENKAVFTAFLDIKKFLRREELQEATIKAIETTLYIPGYEIWDLIRESSEIDFFSRVVLRNDLSQSELVQLKGFNLPTISIENNFQRVYDRGTVFSPIVGYIGRVDANDLNNNPSLRGDDFIGKSGVEFFYDNHLRGDPGIVTLLRDSRGSIIGEGEKRQAQIGESLHLTVDSEFQEYFYWRLKSGLASLGRRIGVGLAMNPQNGEVLAIINLPGFDSNLFVSDGHNEEKVAILNSGDKPLFNRAVGGFYNPGSIIKPLVGVAALEEGIIDSERTIFSPGYLDIPNPYDPENPTRYLDWRYQGDVDLSSAIAKSSNVYFYTIGGGTDDVEGLGINRLLDWWGRFGLGKPTGIDLPGEGEGFLPSSDWKKEKTGNPWLLGDTYNVSIGQGDLLVTPIQLLNYITAIANGGKIYKPVINIDSPHPEILTDLSELDSKISEVQKGMREAVTSLLGTSHLLNDLAFPVAAKTGTAQVQNKNKINSFFVGYAPAYASPSRDASVDKSAGKPEIAILILIEDAREDRLNVVPIAKDVLDWYYWNRIKN